MERSYITDPMHGGKVTCHKCNGFVLEGDEQKYKTTDRILDYDVWFHKDCFNRYEHYYGLDKPID